VSLVKASACEADESVESVDSVSCAKTHAPKKITHEHTEKGEFSKSERLRGGRERGKCVLCDRPDTHTKEKTTNAPKRKTTKKIKQTEQSK